LMIPRKQVRTKQRKMLVVKRIKWNVNKQFFSKKPLLNTLKYCRDWPYHVTNAWLRVVSEYPL
jgi:hypothetical protein